MKLRTYKTLLNADKAANGKPILRIGDLYIVGIDEFTVIDLINEAGTTSATLTCKHFNRLGNANWAKENKTNNWPVMDKAWNDFGI